MFSKLSANKKRENARKEDGQYSIARSKKIRPKSSNVAEENMRWPNFDIILPKVTGKL
jgi:hypothetical protein